MPIQRYKENKYYTTLNSIYLGYRYRWYDVTSSTIPVPYFPKSEISTHENKLGYKQWRKIILCYFRQILNYLYEGNTFELPQQLGSIKLIKTNIPNVNKIKTIEAGKPIFYKSLHTYGYKPRVIWIKRGSRFLYSSFYKFNFTRKAWSIVSQRLLKDGSDILKLNDR